VSAKGKCKAPAKKRGTSVVASPLTTAISKGVSAKSKGKAPAKKRGTSAVDSSPTAATGKGVSAKSKGKAPAKKRGTSAVDSSPITTTGKGVGAGKGRGRVYSRKFSVSVPDCSSLHAMVLPEFLPMIKDLFSEVGVFARSVYEDMVSEQLPPEVSDELSVTEKAIWYLTYMATCETSFVSMCFGEYHTEYRPRFVRSIFLSKIQILSDVDGSLLDFLLELDCAVLREVEYIFNSCWSEVSVSLEEGSLSAISCRDFVRVLNVAGIPAVALSANVEVPTKEGSSKKDTVSEVANVKDLTYSSPPGSQSLSSQSGSQLGSSLPLGEDSGAAPSESAMLSSPDIEIIEAPLVSTEASALTASSSGASLSVQCVDLLGVKLHPDSARIIFGLFSTIRRSTRVSCSRGLYRLLMAVRGELSGVVQAVWCRTYKELHSVNFIAKCLCLYHSNYRPGFVRSLGGIRVLSSSSDHRLVPLTGGELLSFLSKLDCALLEEVGSTFNSEWDELTDKVFSELEGESLSGVVCEDLVNASDAVGIPAVAFSISHGYEKYKKRVIAKSKTLGSGQSSVSVHATVSAVVTSPVGTGKSSVSVHDCASLCAMVLPESALMIEDLFSEIGSLAISVYEDMVREQFPSEMSSRLSVTERAIWRLTYRATCEASFVSMCFGEYHARYRPDFVNSLSEIQVLSDAKGSLLDFLLELDCAICRAVESVFSSCWSEVSVSSEEEFLSAISCGDFVRVLDFAGIPAVALSEKVGVSIKESKGKGASVTSVVDLTHSSPLSPQSLPSQSASHSVGDSVGESSSNLVVAKRHKGNDSFSVPVCTTTAVAQTVSTEAVTVTASAVPTSSSRASLSVQCVDLLGVKLHPCSARLVYDLFSTTRAFAKKSCLRVLSRFLSDVRSEISTVRQAVIWCRTYRKLHLLDFMAKFLCTYHSKYRPDFIRSLANIRVLSSLSDCSLVPLSGSGSLSFLSKLDCAISEEAEALFNLEWDEAAGTAFAGLEDSGAGRADLINISHTVTSPMIAFSISKGYEKYQRRIISQRSDLNKSKTSGGDVGSSWTSLRQIRIEPKPGSSSILSPVIKPVGVLAVSDQPSSVSAVGTVSTVVTSPGDTGSSLLPVIETVPKRRVISESKTSGSSGRCAEGTESGNLAIDIVRSLVASLPRLEPRHGLSSRSELSSKRRLQSKMQLGSLSLSEAGSDQSPRFVKSLFYRDQSVSLSATDTVSIAVALPKGAAGSSSSLAAAESVAASTVSDKPAGVSTTDTVSAAVALPKGAAESSLSLAATG
ncbi:hypothetical protein, partial [Candidatus Ichthyocystis sparus]|uniref:hypothetical protein n=1 Tax=Candidatus Ichthyocystis sparus TaxID=1561004 RepID=UPI00159EF23F